MGVECWIAALKIFSGFVVGNAEDLFHKKNGAVIEIVESGGSARTLYSCLNIQLSC